MATYRVKIQRTGFPVVTGVLTGTPQLVGRSPSADFVLQEDSVSRRHARLYLHDGLAHVEDLESSNGILLNGQRVHDAVVGPSDKVSLGSYTIRIEPITEIGRTAVSQRAELDYKDVAPIHAQIVDGDHPSLSFLYRLSQRMATEHSLRGLLESVLDEVMATLPASRGFVLTNDSAGSEMEICVSKSNRNLLAGAPVSKTLIAHVLDTRSSVLTSDACADDRFESSDSIVAHQIQAAVCAPLTSHDTDFGVIYIDSDAVPMPFLQSHLQLLSIVGQMAGAAVENVVLIQKQIHQERLAAIGETVSATSHDMRNILLGISGGTELLESAKEKRQWDRAEKATRIIRTSLERFDNLVNSLLTCARKTNLCLEENCLGPLAREVAEALGATAAKHNVEILVEDRLEERVLMDAPQVHRVLTNLVKNAIEAMSETGGQIHIDLENADGFCLARINDTGPGINKHDLAHIGQAFFTTKEGHGTGLGLAVCYRIMEQHQGSILVDSELGVGTTFTLKFPQLSKSTVRMRRMTA